MKKAGFRDPDFGFREKKDKTNHRWKLIDTDKETVGRDSIIAPSLRKQKQTCAMHRVLSSVHEQ